MSRSGWRSLNAICAVCVSHRQVGENVGVIRGRAIGSGSSFSSSVTTNAAAVPASRSRTRIVRRCRATPAECRDGLFEAREDRRCLATMAAVRRVFLAGVISSRSSPEPHRRHEPPTRAACRRGGGHCVGRLRRRLGALLVPLRAARDHAAASNFIYPPKLRLAGAKTIYFDLYMNSRVGTPAKPTTEQETVDWAHRIFYRAVASADCSRPWMALNELFGAHTTTPWTANNAQYRHNIIVFAKTLRELGARPFILISSKPYTQGDAGNWWREASHYADLVQEVYFSGRLIHRQGTVAGSRTLRNRFGRRSGPSRTSGFPSRRVGLMLGFQASNRGSAADRVVPARQAPGARRQAGRPGGTDRDRLVVGLAGAEHCTGRPGQGGRRVHLALDTGPPPVCGPRPRDQTSTRH